MKRYRAAMDHIVVSDALRQRVLSMERPAAKQGKWQRWVRPCGVAACAVLVAVAGLWVYLNSQKGVDMAASYAATAEAGMAAADEENEANLAPSASFREQEPVEDAALLDGQTLENPFTQWDSLEKALDALSFEPVLPEAIATYPDLQVSTMDEMLQLCWQADGVAYCYRTAPGDEDLSGDWNPYAETWSWQLSGSEVTLKGEDGLCSLAIWQADGYSFSLSASPAVSQEQLTGWLEE